MVLFEITEAFHTTVVPDFTMSIIYIYIYIYQVMTMMRGANKHQQHRQTRNLSVTATMPGVLAMNAAKGG